MRPLPRRLPVYVRPAHHETLTSYVARLATINGIPYRQLWRHLSATDAEFSRSRTRRLIVVDRLAAATGRQPPDLHQALLELRHPAPDWRQFRHLPQPGCPACGARHDGGTVQQLFRHHEYVCPQHGYVNGPPTYSQDMTPPRLSALIPELLPAQRQHDQLVRRHGWLPAYTAFRSSLITCMTLRNLTASPDHEDPWTGRVTMLIPKPRASYSNTCFIAAFYPEAVQLTALWLSTQWRPYLRQAFASRHDELLPPEPLDIVAAEINRALGRPPSFPTTSVRNHIDQWLFAATGQGSPHTPSHTFLDTRRSTMDGASARPWTTSIPRNEMQRLRQARAEYSRHGHVPPWALVLTGHRYQ